MAEAAVKVVTVSLDELDARIEAAVDRAMTKRSPANDPDVTYMTPKDVAKLLNCSTRSVQRLAATKVLPSRRVGTELRFRRVDVMAYLEQVE